MGYFMANVVLFLLGTAALVIGQVPVTRRRMASGSAARIVGLILMAPLPVYVVICQQSHVPLGSENLPADPVRQVAEGYVRLSGVAVAIACVLVAGVLAIVTSEPPRRP